MKSSSVRVLVTLWLALMSQLCLAQAQTLIVVGDSLSAEYGIRKDSGWVHLLNAKLKEQGYSYSVINASISGDTTSGGLSRLPSLLKQHNPKWVIIELGGNDALQGISLDTTRTNLKQMITLAETSGAKVILVGMMVPANFGAKYNQQFNGIYRELARPKQLVPFLLEGFAEDASLFQTDGIHPTEQAQAMMRDNVWKVLAPLLR